MLMKDHFIHTKFIGPQNVPIVGEKNAVMTGQLPWMFSPPAVEKDCLPVAWTPHAIPGLNAQQNGRRHLSGSELPS